MSTDWGVAGSILEPLKVGQIYWFAASFAGDLSDSQIAKITATLKCWPCKLGQPSYAEAGVLSVQPMVAKTTVVWWYNPKVEAPVGAPYYVLYKVFEAQTFAHREADPGETLLASWGGGLTGLSFDVAEALSNSGDAIGEAVKTVASGVEATANVLPWALLGGALAVGGYLVYAIAQARHRDDGEEWFEEDWA